MPYQKTANRKTNKSWAAKKLCGYKGCNAQENQREPSYCGLKGKILWQHASGVQT